MSVALVNGCCFWWTSLYLQHFCNNIICAGFKQCGIYPFNPWVIDCSISTENPEASLTRPSDEQTETENGLMENGDENTVTEFSIKQEQRFQTRSEEWYDLMDSKYLRWLEINHPDLVFLLTDICLSLLQNPLEVWVKTLLWLMYSHKYSHRLRLLWLNVLHPITLHFSIVMRQLWSQLKVLPLSSLPLMRQLVS